MTCGITELNKIIKKLPKLNQQPSIFLKNKNDFIKFYEILIKIKNTKNFQQNDYCINCSNSINVITKSLLNQADWDNVFLLK